MRRHVTVRVDDIDKTSEATETITYALDGVKYEIDLTATNAASLRRDLAFWIAKSRRAGKVYTNATGKTKTTGAPEIRKWGNDHGFNLSPRGRIPNEVYDAFHAHNPTTQEK